MRGDSCRTCNALIVWATTVKGKAIPIDAAAVPTGNVGLEQPNDPREPPIAHVAPNIPADRVSSIRFVSHFVTCPQAALHRKEKTNA